MKRKTFLGVILGAFAAMAVRLPKKAKPSTLGLVASDDIGEWQNVVLKRRFKCSATPIPEFGYSFCYTVIEKDTEPS